MLRSSVLCVLLVCLTASSVAAQDADPIPVDAYADARARELVRLAREHRSTVDRRIESYSTTARDRFSVSLRAGVVEKLLMRRETATRIDWERDGEVRLEVLGIREWVPLANPLPEVPRDMSADMLMLAFDPATPDMLVRLDTAQIMHPLMQQGERHYRYASGDSTIIALPDGRTVRLREVRVIPRRRSPELFSGSLWLEAESHAVVQVHMRLARALEGDTDISVHSDSGGWLTPFIAGQVMGLLKPLRLTVDFLAIEYGLYELEWWLPRVAVARGVAQIGRFHVPISYERTYSDYEVHGDPAGASAIAADSVSRCRRVVRYLTPDGTPDTIRQPVADSEAERRARAQGAAAPTAPCAQKYVIVAPGDSALLYSAELPELDADVFTLVDDAELNAIVERVRSLASAPWSLRRPVLQWGFEGSGLTRYNRIEGLSTGVRVLLGAGPFVLKPEVRYGFADGALRGELALERGGTALDASWAAYRRLRSATPSPNVHGTVATLGAVLIGRDEDEYFDARGSELVLRPAATRRQWYETAVYAEQQRPVEQHASFSVAGLIDADRRLGANFTADRADQLGARLTLRHSLGSFPGSVRVDGETTIGGETGDYRFLRGEALLRALAPLPRGFSVALEGAAGALDGDSVPVQALWRLGGASSLRGYERGSVTGEQYWRTRAELRFDSGNLGLVSVFTDAAQAGPRTAFGESDVLRSLGFGIEPLRGLLHIDFARGLDTGRWRLHVQLNRAF